jgi:hypothetical protein
LILPGRAKDSGYDPTESYVVRFQPLASKLVRSESARVPKRICFDIGSSRWRLCGDPAKLNNGSRWPHSRKWTQHILHDADTAHGGPGVLPGGVPRERTPNDPW